ncbi:MFS transporter [Pseudomonas sp. MIACH]|uniref:MFS transporter n=1 Tax=Pseudomonas sp. MIACH TaxID=1078355 RepID=UPI00069ED545|nr:MFS transporter [Pseudomonas sp. MIACH]
MSPNTHFTPLILAGIALLCGLSVANVYFNQALLPVFAGALHADAGQTSWIATASQMGYALGMLLIVPLGDRVAPLRLCRLLLVWTAALLLLASQATLLSMLAGASFLLCTGTCIPQVLLPYLAGLATAGERSRVIAWVQTGLVTGILLSRAIAGWLADHLGWQSVYWVAAAAMLMCALALPSILPRRQAPGVPVAYGRLLSSMLHLFWHEPLLRLSCALGAAVFAAFSAFWSVIAFKLMASPYSMNAADVGLFSLWGALATLLTPAAGKLCERFGTVAISLTSIVLCSLSFALSMAWANTFLVLLACANLLSFALQLGQVANQTRIFSLSPDSRSRLNTVYMVCNFCGGAFGSAMGGYLWQRFGWTGCALLGLLCAVLAMVALLAILRPRPKQLATV